MNGPHDERDAERLASAVLRLYKRYEQLDRDAQALATIADLPADESSATLGALVNIRPKPTDSVSNYALSTHRALIAVCGLTGMTRAAVAWLILHPQEPNRFWYSWAAQVSIEDLQRWQQEPPERDTLRTLVALRGWNVADLDGLPSPPPVGT